MNLSALIPWPCRMLVIAGLIAACIGYGWIKGADHVQTKWNAEQQVQAVRVVRIQAKQTQATQEIDHATRSLVSRSDDYYRLRLKPVQADPVPGASGSIDAAAAPAESDPSGPDWPPVCSPADGAADALVILGWQEWVRAMQAAQR